MNILFAALHQGYYRNLDSIVEELARRGHQVHLGSERPDSAFGGQAMLERLIAAYPNLTAGRIPPREADSLFLASKIRLGFDYLRYLEPMYHASSGLRPRAEVRTPVGLVRLSRTALESRPWARRLVASVLDGIDRAVPPSPAIEAYLDEQRPDLVLITPLIGLVATSQLDLLRSAQARRIPTAVFVWSWDHLSSKGVIRDCPDGLFVWNDAQKQEATGMHRVPADRVVVTGAQCYDRWFGRQPARSRSEFVRHAGLPDERPYVLWVCSALLPGSPHEPDVVMRWARSLRASTDPRVRDANILIRPHPSRAEWDDVDWRSLGNIALCGQSPIDSESRAEYFDSLYHSAAVVGITTSAFIEAAIVGRPVMAILEDDLKQEHEGSLHFQHLLTVGGGLLTTARTLAEHASQLAEMFDGPPAAVLERQRRFVEAFVRPHGLDVPATGMAVDALERLANTSVGRATAPHRAGALGTPPSGSPREPEGFAPHQSSSAIGRLGLRALQAVERHPRWRYLLLDEREGQSAARQDDKRRLREEALARKQQQRAEKARRSALKSRGA